MQYSVGQNIIFYTPYFENQFYFHAKIIEIKNLSLVVSFSNCVEDGKVYKYVNHETEIPLNSVVN
jgi:hypothetical protein